jgi:allantoate deiminase
MNVTLRPSQERLARDLAALAEHGQDPAGGMTRLALTVSDAAARDYVRGRMLELGMTVSHDDVGNLIGRLAGKDPSAACVMTGSHLDTVPRGGRYDGPLGVVGALEAVRALVEAGVSPRRPIDVIVFTGEEGSRFGRGTIGSAALCGEIPVATIHALTDAQGITFEAALATYRDPGPARPAAVPSGSVFAFVELHIEQGGVLEQKRVPIGAVTTVNGLRQLIVKLRGDANHAGATPMDLRRDALVCAAELVRAVDRIPRELGEGAVATVGKLEVEPNAYNIIPGLVTLGIDARAPTQALLDQLEERITGAARQVPALSVEVTRRQAVAPGPLDERVISAVERGAVAEGLRSFRMPSGAIHDALHMASFCPSGMIFIPSQGGKSHCPEEDSSPGDMILGVEVLARTLADLAD